MRLYMWFYVPKGYHFSLAKDHNQLVDSILFGLVVTHLIRYLDSLI